LNIDFHYGVVYAVARLGGLNQTDAQTVAHACQYVDDATTGDLLHFSGGQTFERIASAHEMIDYKNSENSENRRIWVPFHFLPGAQGQSLDERAICRPNSDVAKAMVRHMLAAVQHSDNALHRLGVTLHVYVDTWAHQGFSGIVSDNNRIHHLEGDEHDYHTWRAALTTLLARAGLDVANVGIDLFSGLGHGAALHFPDMPWAKWRYMHKGSNVFVERDNLPDFIEAANMACKVVQAYVEKSNDFESQVGLSPNATAALADLMQNNRDIDPDERLDYLRHRIAANAIPEIGFETIPDYVHKGIGSWKHAATTIEADDDGDWKPEWAPAFEDSDYRKFHDATMQHRFVIVQEILPKFGLRLD
jgi:hypothetical protein